MDFLNRRIWFGLFVVGLLTTCGDSDRPAGTVLDAGVSPDAGATPDAEVPTPDVEAIPDAGASPDAGADTDTVPTPDGGGTGGTAPPAPPDDGGPDSSPDLQPGVDARNYEDFFQIDQIHQIDVIIPAAEWDAFLLENQAVNTVPIWRQADFRIDGVMTTRVGFKTFGFGSRVENPGKPNLNLDFNRNVIGQSHHGIGKMRLKNNGQDPSALRQAITYEAMRASGLLAPRSSYAELSVNGQPFGFYFIEEAFSRAFVKERTGNDNGAGYEADDCQGFVPPEPGGCPALPMRYLRSFNAVVGTGEDLAMLCSVMNGPATDFVAGVSSLIKLDEWLGAVAADTAIAGNYDGYSTNGANFRLYHDTALNRLRIVILGPDTTYDPNFSPDPSVPKPDDNCLIANPQYRDVFLEKLRGTPEGVEMYKQAVRTLRQGAMAPAMLKARVDALWTAIGDHAKADLHRVPTADPEASKEQIKRYIDLRDADLTAKGF